jgi:ubiquinone/menaquinone biosynthesis C-methylase UbiE
MGFYEREVLPRIVDVALSGKQLDRLRGRVAARLDGEVLEVGFGSGRNVPHYPASVTRVRAVDPALVGRKIAAPRVAASPVPIEYIGLEGERLPVEDQSIDHVLTTWTLCTIPEVDRAVAEIHRVLRPGGSLEFLEHGRAADTNVQKWQDRITPLQRRLAGGCHLNRPIDALLTDGGLHIDRLDNYYIKGPKVFGYMYEGTATRR